MPRSSRWAVVLLAAGCAQPAPEAPPAAEPVTLGALPVTYLGMPGCPGCLELTLTLRADGSYLSRERVGGTDFHDFGRWRFADGVLEATGETAVRRYPLRGLKRAPQVQALSGPFRMVGSSDGTRFTECLTGLAWPLAESRVLETLRRRLAQQGGRAMVAIDARLEGAPERLALQRAPSVLNSPSCPG